MKNLCMRDLADSETGFDMQDKAKKRIQLLFRSATEEHLIHSSVVTGIGTLKRSQRKMD